MNSLKNKKIVLLGGAGFIGHHLALRLVKEGAHVEIIDGMEVNNLLSFIPNSQKSNQNDRYFAFIQKRLALLQEAQVPIHVLDARDYHRLTIRLTSIRPDVIVHMAAIAHADRSNKDPNSTFGHSLRTLENALDYSRDNLGHFVFFSSSMVYGNFKTESVTEDSLCEPIGIYGALKFAGEKIVVAYNQVFDLPYTIVRPSALYGERCVSRRAGQIFIESAFADQEINVAGDGSERLDFTYISDLVQGIQKVLENEKSKNQVFNLTYGESRPLLDMIHILRKHFPNLKVKHTDRDRLMPKRGTLSVDKAKTLLGYQPKYPLDRGYDEYISWYKSFMK